MFGACDPKRQATMNPIDLQLVMVPIGVGIAATVVLDAWALFISRAFGAPVTNWGRVGRWVCGLPGGIYPSTPIAEAAPVAHESALGWLTHYVVGVIYAFTYLAVAGAASMEPTLASAVLFGVATVLAPWLILQPGLGLGFFASAAPRPNLTRALNVISHTVFGLGLYVGWHVLTVF
jgi:hypothetical protein